MRQNDCGCFCGVDTLGLECVCAPVFFRILYRYLPGWPSFLWILWRTPVYLLPTFVFACRDMRGQQVKHESRCYLFSLVHQDLRQDCFNFWYYYLPFPCSFDCMSA
jgi:hypothetical protein